MRKTTKRHIRDSKGAAERFHFWVNRVKYPVLPLVLFISLVLFGVCPGFASDTMLMFVGEDLEILSLASRREEAAWNAPAIAHVITWETIDNAGDATIADLLEKTPGFYVNEREQGSVPYLRGIPDSALFLFDTVSMGSGANKSYHNIDNEVFLTSVKRIEIVRGAGSVLWGPDAFAGVVNVVPFTGADFQGVETGVGGSSLDESRSAFVKYGVDKGRWSSFVSVSARSVQEDDDTYNVVKFWNDGGTAAPELERMGSDTLDDSQYYEVYSSISFDRWLTLSARVSDANKVYTVSDGTGDYTWKEERSNPTRTFKVEASKSTGIDSGIRFTGYYTDYDLDLDIIDKAFDQSEQSLYGELIYDQSLFTGDGLLTTGVSWRENKFSDTLVWKSFMPNYLEENESNWLPIFETKDYENRLGSVFGQYRHRFSSLELWAGVRSDDHDQFEDKVSYSLGAAWSFSPGLLLKTIYGTAYRTPFASQVSQDDDIALEHINSTNVQLAWMPGKETKVSLTLFRNEIDNHVVEDRYEGVGLSSPNSQTIDGAELEWDFKLTDRLSFAGNVTVLNNSGSDETYLYSWYDVGDDPVYTILNYDYDAGAETMANLSLNWRVTDHITVVPELRYFSSTQFHYFNETGPSDIETITIQCPEVWLMDFHLKIKDIFPFSLDFFVENLWDEQYSVPGMYSVIQGQSFNAGVLIKMRW